MQKHSYFLPIQDKVLTNYDKKVAVVTLNYNNYELTAKCIESLQKCSYSNLMIVLVDNLSKDGSGEKLRDEFSGIKYIKSEYNGGYAAGMNLGLKYAFDEGADYFLILNNDTEVVPGFLEPLVELAESNKEIGLIAPKVLYAPNTDTIYCAGAEFRLLRVGSVALGRHLKDEGYPHKIEEKNAAEGAAMFVTRAAFEKVGFMNEIYFLYYEDFDLSKRIGQYFKIYYQPESIIYHYHGSGKDWSSFTDYYHYYFTRNRLILFAEYNLFIRLYAMMFVLLNVSAKSGVVTLGTIKRDKKIPTKTLKHIWMGYLEGLMYLLRIKKPKSGKPIIKKFS